MDSGCDRVVTPTVCSPNHPLPQVIQQKMERTNSDPRISAYPLRTFITPKAKTDEQIAGTSSWTIHGTTHPVLNFAAYIGLREGFATEPLTRPTRQQKKPGAPGGRSPRLASLPVNTSC